MDKITKKEIEAFEKLEFKPDLKPYFDPMRYCLRWEDEEPETVTRDIYEKFLNLLIVRSYIHEGRPKNEWYIIKPTTYFSDFWEHAKETIPNWPGFKRIELSESDKEYFETEKNKDPDEHF